MDHFVRPGLINDNGKFHLFKFIIQKMIKIYTIGLDGQTL